MYGVLGYVPTCYIHCKTLGEDGLTEVLNNGVDLSIWQCFVSPRVPADSMICNEGTAVKEGVENRCCHIARTENRQLERTHPRSTRFDAVRSTIQLEPMMGMIQKEIWRMFNDRQLCIGVEPVDVNVCFTKIKN